jgi:hypothetical protein
MDAKKIVAKVERDIKTPAPDLTNQDVCNLFCVQYGTAIAPELRAIDKSQARSMAKAFTRVVR